MKSPVAAESPARAATNAVAGLLLSARIRAKWLLDGRRLPLTQHHFTLYSIIHRLCIEHLGHFPQLVDCRDYNDRIQWLKLFDQAAEVVRCTDKLGVRDYVRERVGDEHLVRLYQVHDRFAQFDFDALPPAFVLKTNHDSGTVILVRDKASIDRTTATRIEQSLARIYGHENGEWAYVHVPPKVFAEELIAPGNSTPPPDYKFHCVDGKIRWLQFIYDRGHGTKEVIADVNGQPTGIHFDHNMANSTSFSIPPRWNDMKVIAEALASGFRYVRIDMYQWESRIYVGELTFFPMMGCYKGDGQKALGHLLDFDRGNAKPLFAAQA